MTIGTSLGNHYQDEHHYQARSFTPFPGFHQSENVEDRRQEFFDPRTDPVYRDRNEDESLLGGYMSKDLDPYDEQYTKLGGELGVADLMVASAKQVRDRKLMLEEQTKMEDELAAAEKKAGVTPEDSGLPGDEWQQWNSPLPRKGPDLPRKKTDQEIRDEANQMKFFDTPLSSDEESKFQKWKALMAPKDSGEDYDLRGAFKAGITPDKETGHWPDTYKKPNHPTFSDQSQYAKDAPDLAGSWSGDQYIPPANK